MKRSINSEQPTGGAGVRDRHQNDYPELPAGLGHSAEDRDLVAFNKIPAGPGPSSAAVPSKNC